MKRYSLLMATLFAVLIAGAQSINLHMNNGEVIKYNSAEVDYIDFSENSGPDNPGNIISYTSCPDSHHPHLIDLGLPSGTKWACCNVGANSPEQYGGYYAWGETVEKSTYTSSNYLDGKGTTYDIGKNIAGTQYDAATANWGSPWMMPSLEQIKELNNSCTYEWTTENGVNGMKFTGPSGGTIFLPAAGSRSSGDLYNAGSYGYYWSSTLDVSLTNDAWRLGVSRKGTDGDCSGRRSGRSVRPVRKN